MNLHPRQPIDPPIRQRTPEERVAYVAGFAAGWKQAVVEHVAVRHWADPEREVLRRLDMNLDLMSSVENDLREKGA